MATDENGEASENDNCEALLTSSYIMAYGLISAITWLIIAVIFMLLQNPIIPIATRIAFEKSKSGISPQLKGCHRHFFLAKTSLFLETWSAISLEFERDGPISENRNESVT